MAKLMDIKGYYNMAYGRDFNDKDMWEGQILLQGDGWFEGIVVDPNSSYKEDRFVFGVYHPDKIIELFKFAPFSVSAPLLFHGEREAKGYEGNFEKMELLNTVSCGSSHIITQYVETVRQGVEEESQKLEERIQRFKDIIMDGPGKTIYENIIDMRSVLVQLVLRNYKGKGVFQESMDDFSEKQEPKFDDMRPTDVDIKMITKKIPDPFKTKFVDLFVDEEDE